MIELMARATSYGSRTAVRDASGEVTYALLHGRAVMLAGTLLTQVGLTSGDTAVDLAERRVAVLVRPGAEWVVAMWSVWMAGGLAVPLSPQHPPAEWCHMLDDASVSAVIVDDANRIALSHAIGARALVVLSSATAERASLATFVALPDVTPDRRAMMLYTSGTTGRPKGVVHTHASLEAQVQSLVQAWGWTASDRTLLVLPLHHVHGVMNVMACALGVGAFVVVHERFDAEAAWRVISDDALTLFQAVPTIWARLLASFNACDTTTQAARRAALAEMRLLVSGSAALPVSLLDQWQHLSGHVLLERYGMTELGMALSNPLHGMRVPGHVGLPLPGVEVRAVHDDGSLVAAGESGALEVRGPTVMREYWQRAAETADAFRDGWFRTGDVAVLEDTKGGPSWRLLGRQSTDIIKTGGYKVSALEIEEVLRTHPSVAECAVVGVPDEEWGERVVVAVELAAACTLALDELRGFLKERLATYKVPSALATPDALPRNVMGKVVKLEVRRLFDAPVS